MDEASRTATSDDIPELARIERSGEAMFAAIGMVFPPGPMVIETIAADATFVIVAGEPIVGFAAVIDLDGRPHLEQVSVDAEHV